MKSANLSHLKFLTDDFGIWQFCTKSGILKQYGYTLDDNARALITALLYKKEKLAKIYFDYLKYSFKKGLFYGEVDANKKREKYPSSEDSFGEAVWALGLAFRHKFYPKEVLAIFKKLKSVDQLRYARGLAYSILGLIYLDFKKALDLGDKLISKFPQKNQWFWPEKRLTYANGIIPYALLRLYMKTKEKKFYKVGLKSLVFLEQKSRINNIPAPIGNKTWFSEKGRKDHFDQQPIDAAYMTFAWMAAFETRGKKDYFNIAKEWFSWFYGNNIIGVTLYDKKTGKVFDGILKNGISQNSGAEPIVSYLICRWILEKWQTV